MRNRQVFCLAAALALCAAVAGADDKYLFFPRAAKSAKSAATNGLREKDAPVQRVSFGPEFSTEPQTVPRVGTNPRTRTANRATEEPLLFEPDAAGEAFLSSPPPEPAPFHPTPAAPMPVGPAPDEPAATHPTFSIAPGPVPQPAIGPPPDVGLPVDGASVSLLYPRVRYKDLKNVHPCAVTKVVAVADPCRDCGCVYVQICVPPNCCPKVKTKRGGREVEYDYGDYDVEVKSKDGYVEVDYDD